MKKYSKMGLRLVIPYILLVLVAFAYASIMQMSYPGKSEFSGVYITVLTFPWSLLSTLLLVLLALLGVDFSLGAKIIIMIGALLNILIIYKVGRKLSSQATEKNGVDK